MSEAIFEQDSKGEENATLNEEKGSEEGKQEAGSSEQEAGSEASGEGVGEASDQTETDRAAGEAEPEEISEKEKAASEEKETSEQEVRGDDEEIVLEVPKDTILTDEYLEKAASHYTEKGYTKEQAQDIISRESEVAKDSYTLGIEDTQADAKKQLEEASVKWAEELENDPEFGGDNAKETRDLANQVLEQYFPENLREWLGEFKVDKHHDFIKAFRNIAADLKMANDEIERGGNVGTKKKKTDAELFYPES